MIIDPNNYTHDSVAPGFQLPYDVVRVHQASGETHRLGTYTSVVRANAERDSARADENEVVVTVHRKEQ